MTTIATRLIRYDRKASVAVFVAVALPFLIIATVLSMDISGYWLDYAKFQGVADAASDSGALTYKSTLNTRTAANQAAHMAELNGVTGSASPTWTSATNTLNDGNITVVVTPGGNTASGATVQVSIAQTASASVAAAVNPTNVVIHTRSTSKVAPPPGTTSTPSSDGDGLGGQPCMLALNGEDTGVTTGTDITFSGHVTISTPGCTIRSNAGMNFQGNVTITAAAFYAGGTITINGGSASVSGTQYPMNGQIADPYALASAPDGPNGSTYIYNGNLQNALTGANQATGVNADLSCNSSGCTGPAGLVSCSSGSSCTAQPGTYGNWTSSNGPTLTLAPGLYIVTGSISLTGGTITGSGVTILMAAGSSGSPNTATIVGGTSISLTATTNGSNHTLPGVVFASTTTGAVSFGGNASVPFSGLIYLPNGSLKFAGTPASNTTCTMVIAETIAVSGNVNLTSSSCASYGLPAFGSYATPPTLAVSLYQ
jgi:Flp pilus assembly protein TadG